MPQIRCRYIDCIFLESDFCSAEIVKIDPDEGCITYTNMDDIPIAEEEDWEDEEIEEIWEDEEEDGDEDEKDWIEDNLF